MNMTLVQVLSDPNRMRAVVIDGDKLIESEVASKRGLSGMAVKAGFKTMKKVKPGVIAEALEMLLPKFAPAVDPHFAKARASGDVGKYFVGHGNEIAEAMLGVTDARAERAQHRVLKRAYYALRPAALGHVVAAMPGLADLVDKHVPK